MYYTKDGYIDFKTLYSKDKSIYKFILGARAIGKTFGELKFWIDRLKGTGRKFVYMRRTQTQIDLIRTPELNPFKALYEELGEEYSFILAPINKNVTGIYFAVYEPESNAYIKGEHIGYMLALSTISNIRGFAGNDIEHIIYDEFTGEVHEKPIRNEGMCFLNAIETIGRNRETAGKEPLTVTCLSNSNLLANPIFMELGFITKCEKALNKGSKEIRLPERATSIYFVSDSPISKKKQTTSLYMLAGDQSEFSHMSLHNEFTGDHFEQIKSRDLREFRIICNVGEISIYKHKNKREWYVSEHRQGTPDSYSASDTDLKRFRQNYYYLELAHMNRHIIFENYITQVLFEKYLKI